MSIRKIALAQFSNHSISRLPSAIPPLSLLGTEMDYRPTIAITMGDPAGIGPEVIVKALADPILRHKARYIIYGMNELLAYAADLAEFDVFWWRARYDGRPRSFPHDVVVVDYAQYT